MSFVSLFLGHGVCHCLSVSVSVCVWCRTDEQKRRYTGALCGLGSDINSDEGDSVFPEHDMEIIFDSSFDLHDLQLVSAPYFYIISTYFYIMECSVIMCEKWINVNVSASIARVIIYVHMQHLLVVTGYTADFDPCRIGMEPWTNRKDSWELIISKFCANLSMGLLLLFFSHSSIGQTCWNKFFDKTWLDECEICQCCAFGVK